MARLTYDLPPVAIRYNSDFELTGENAVKDGKRLNEQNVYSLHRIAAFMEYVLEREQLTIRPYLEDMGFMPYFLLASTGLGKTLAAPIHSYLNHCAHILAGAKSGPALWGKAIPRIWIIEPKISIVQAQTDFMNSLFADFVKERSNLRDVEHPVLFGCKTSVQAKHKFAPIQFVTTGIYAIYARFGYINPEQDCVIIDESHVTIESSEGVELAIGICRALGIPVHYMSATVDKTNLRETLGVHTIVDATDKVRKPKWIHNTTRKMEDCIVELVEKTLVHPDPKSEFFPHGNDSDTKEILRDVLEKGRAKGFLIVVNSFAGEDSDANKIKDLLLSSSYASEIEVLPLASAVIRDPKAKRRFDEDISRIRRLRKKFVIIATSVVEMGVTFEDLDFVATMDSGYEQITIGDTVLPEISALPVNSMLQRIGRVGRKRAGIGYITNEVDAYYSSFTDQELNSKLTYEPIRLPLKKGSLALVALYSFRQEWQDPIGELVKLNLPSKIHEDSDRVFEFMRQRMRLLDLGIAVDNRLTDEGKYCERWLEGGVDTGYAIEIQKALALGSKEDLFFYLVAATLSDINLGLLRDKEEGISTIDLATRYDSQTGHPRLRRGIVLKSQEIELTPQSEVIALYNLVCYFSNKYAKLFFNRKSMHALARASYQDALRQDCATCGFDGEKIEKLLQGFTSILKILCDTNWNRDDFKTMFGAVRKLDLTGFSFSPLSEWDTQLFMETIATLPGRTRIIITAQEQTFAWQEIGGERAGMLYPDSTALVLENELVLTAKLVPLPGRGDRKAGDAWKVVHAQYEDLQKSVIPVSQEKQETKEESPEIEAAEEGQNDEYDYEEDSQ